MFAIFNNWHIIIFLFILVLVFLFVNNPIYNVFLFMLICIQTFIFLAIFPKQYFFALLLLIIYLGAIIVLFLFVVLVLGSLNLNVVETKNNIFFEKYLYVFFFIFIFFNFIIKLFYNFLLWSVDFQKSIELENYYTYIAYLKKIKILLLEYFNNLELFIFSSDFKKEYFYIRNLLVNNKNISYHFSADENFCYEYVNALCKPEMFNFEEYSNTFFQLKNWSAILFFKDVSILYLCAFILFLATIGVIVLIVNRK